MRMRYAYEERYICVARADLHVHSICTCWRASLRNQTTAGRMERLTSALKSVLDRKHDLQTVVSALENLTLPPLLKRESLTAESKQ